MSENPNNEKVKRENPNRALFVTAEITWQTYEKLIPSITHLRLTSSDPICLFIDSHGGDVNAAEAILTLIRTPNQDGKRCLLTTVSVNVAASAAADLLAAGDYAIAYKHSLVLCHGTRHSRPHLTLEDVPRVAANLRETNERFALRLADMMFRRLVTLAALTSGQRETGTLGFTTAISDPEKLLHQIKEKLQPANQKLVDTALDRQNDLRQLLSYVQQQNQKNPLPEGVQGEAHILKQIVDYEAQRATKSQIDFSDGHLSAIQEDFVRLKDFFFGQFRDRLLRIIKQRGRMFLEPEELKEFNTIPPTERDQRKTFLVSKTYKRLEQFWYLVVSICRILQEGEFTFSASEALWLGLVDEALGANLPSLRKFTEWKAKQLNPPSKATKLET